MEYCIASSRKLNTFLNATSILLGERRVVAAAAALTGAFQITHPSSIALTSAARLSIPQQVGVVTSHVSTDGCSAVAHRGCGALTRTRRHKGIVAAPLRTRSG